MSLTYKVQMIIKFVAIGSGVADFFSTVFPLLYDRGLVGLDGEEEEMSHHISRTLWVDGSWFKRL